MLAFVFKVCYISIGLAHWTILKGERVDFLMSDFSYNFSRLKTQTTLFPIL